jgi:hypothetical protein
MGCGRSKKPAKRGCSIQNLTGLGMEAGQRGSQPRQVYIGKIIMLEKTKVKGVCYSGDEIVSEAEALFLKTFNMPFKTG